MQSSVADAPEGRFRSALTTFATREPPVLNCASHGCIRASSPKKCWEPRGALQALGAPTAAPHAWVLPPLPAADRDAPHRLLPQPMSGAQQQDVAKDHEAVGLCRRGLTCPPGANPAACHAARLQDQGGHGCAGSHGSDDVRSGGWGGPAARAYGGSRCRPAGSGGAACRNGRAPDGRTAELAEEAVRCAERAH